MQENQLLIGVCSREGTKNHVSNPYTLLVSLADPEIGSKGIHRPKSVEKHLLLTFHDLDDIEAKAPKYAGCIKPTHTHVKAIFEAFQILPQKKKQGALVHCEAGVSRSTAAAILGLCSLGIPPETAFTAILQMNPLGLPNRRMLRLGQEILGIPPILTKMAEAQRKEAFALHQQPDPIALLEKEIESRHPAMLKLDYLLRKLESLLKGCQDAALEKTLERWRTKVQMAQKEPQRETLRKLGPATQSP